MRPPPLDPHAALFLDFDGTLVEIAERPELVRVPPSLPTLLARLAAQREGALAVVSGRPLAQLDALLAPWRGAAAGLHGEERRLADLTRAANVESAADRAAAASLRELRPSLVGLTQAFPGIWLEDKGSTLALHYRAVPDAGEMLADRLVPLAAAHPGLRLLPGKMVFELKPSHHGKNAAVAAFLAEPPFQGRAPVFLGDDRTDEDGFAEVNRRGGLSIRVVAAVEPTQATYRLRSVNAVLRWLRASAANPGIGEGIVLNRVAERHPHLAVPNRKDMAAAWVASGSRTAHDRTRDHDNSG